MDLAVGLQFYNVAFKTPYDRLGHIDHRRGLRVAGDYEAVAEVNPLLNVVNNLGFELLNIGWFNRYELLVEPGPASRRL